MRLSNKFRLMICFAILANWLAHPSPAGACLCVADIAISDHFAMHDAVFAGKIARIVDNYVPIFSTSDYVMYKLGYSTYFFDHFARNDARRLEFSVFFKVINSWKGLDTSTIEVSTGRGGGDCGYSFLTNEEYLVYASHAYGRPDGYWVTSTCSRTAELSNAADDFLYLDALPTIQLKPAIAIFWTERDTILLVLTSIPIMFSVFLASKRRQRKSSP